MKVLIIGGGEGKQAAIRDAICLSITSAGGTIGQQLLVEVPEIYVLDELGNMSIRQLHELKEEIGIERQLAGHYAAIRAWPVTTEQPSRTRRNLSEHLEERAHGSDYESIGSFTGSYEARLQLTEKERDYLNSLYTFGNVLQEETQRGIEQLDLSMTRLREATSGWHEVSYSVPCSSKPAGHYTPARDAAKRRRAKNRAQRHARRKNG